MKYHAFYVSFFAAALTAGAVETNRWMTTTANTPLAPHLWTDGANWKNVRTGLTGTVPADLDHLQFTRGSKPFFVKMPDEVYVSQSTLTGSGSDTNCFLIGEKWFVAGHVKNNCYYNWIFADLYTRRPGDIEDVDPWFAGNHIAGRLIVPSGGNSLGRLIVSSSTTYLRLDCFATSPDPLRTDDLQIPGGSFVPGNANFQVMAAGADASTSTWSLTPGSPYIQAAGEYAPVAVGAAVTGAGIPAGTWVRRKFGRTGWLELSQSVSGDAAAGSASLAFAAFHPDARIEIANLSTQGSGESLFVLTKEHVLDQLTFEVTNLTCSSSKTMRWGLGIPKSHVDAGLLPGKLKLHTISSYRVAPITITHNLYNIHLELAGTATGGNTAFGAKCLVGFGDTGSVARITVPAGKTAEIAAFTNFNGTLVKDGAGTLRIGLAGASGQGGITVEEGVLELSALSSAGTEPIGFADKLTMTGGTLAIPEQGLVFSSASFSSDSVVRGPGAVATTQPRGEGEVPVLEDGAAIRYGGNAAADGYVHNPAAEVAGHPAFWVDASKRDSFVLENEGGVDYVRRWNDWREGEPMFATNISRRPLLHWGDEMTNKYVKIARVSTTSIAETEGLVWSVPIDRIRAVFMVHDPVDGGGALLGRTSRLPDNYYGSQGGPFYHSDGSYVVGDKYGTDRVKYGRFFRDGNEFIGYTTVFVKVPQVMEFHANTAYWSRAGVKEELVCDAFGTGCYKDKNSLKSDDGRQRLSEVLIYTNSLTHAERVRTAMYLSRKWLGKDIVYSDVDESAYAATAAYGEGEGVRVNAGEAAGIRILEGGGPLVKDGAGMLVVEALKAGTVRVDAGELVVKSMALGNSALPGTPWTHMDALDATSVTTNAAGEVSNWTSVNGDGQSYQPIDTVKPVYRVDSVTGRPMIDLGAFNVSASAALKLHLADDTEYVHANNQPGYISSPYIKARSSCVPRRAAAVRCWAPWVTVIPGRGFLMTVPPTRSRRST